MARIESKRWLAGASLFWIGLLIAGLILGLVMWNNPAHAAADKRVQQKRQYWAMIRYYTAPNQVGEGAHIESYTVSIAANYLYWKDGDDPDKVAVVGGSVCYHRNTGRGTLFQGVNSNPFFRDDVYVVNPGAIEVEDDNTDDNCDVFNIPNSERRWFKMKFNAGWFATGKVRIKWGPDDNFRYKWSGLEFRNFTPKEDTDIGDSFLCSCDWPGQ